MKPRFSTLIWTLVGMGLFFTAPAMGTQNLGYQVLQTGAFYHIYPQTISSQLDWKANGPYGQHEMPNCRATEKSLQALLRDYQDFCVDNRGVESHCELIRGEIFLLGNGKPSASHTHMPNIARKVVQKWVLSEPSVSWPSNPQLIKKSVMETHGLKSWQVLIADSSQLVDEVALKGKVALSFKSDSMTKAYQDITLDKSEDMVKISPRQDYILTQNKFLACDLASGQAHLQLHSPQKLEFVERASTQTINGLWQAYQDFSNRVAALKREQTSSPIVEAALYGYQLAEAMRNQVDLENSVYDVPEVLTGFVKVSPQAIVGMKTFHSKSEMKSQSFSDVKHESEFNLIWSLK